MAILINEIEVFEVNDIADTGWLVSDSGNYSDPVFDMIAAREEESGKPLATH